MQIRVLASDQKWNELTGSGTAVTWLKAAGHEDLLHDQESDALFNLADDAADADYGTSSRPVFIHSVVKTIKQSSLPVNVVRINAWPGFLQRGVWEMAGTVSQAHHEVMRQLNKKPAAVADEPGLVAAPVIAMIVNEAFYALQEGISTKPEIDTAMKLGTNYPHGPFEWADLIGLSRLLELLDALSANDPRYQPAAQLRTAAGSPKS